MPNKVVKLSARAFAQRADAHYASAGAAAYNGMKSKERMAMPKRSCRRTLLVLTLLLMLSGGGCSAPEDQSSEGSLVGAGRNPEMGDSAMPPVGSPRGVSAAGADASSSGAIHEGFFWDQPLAEMSFKSRVLAVLAEDRLDEVRRLLQQELTELSPHGWYLGIPDRTLLLPGDGLRLVYGGSMGDEIGVRTMDGKSTRGFFRSEKLVSILRRAEGE